MMTIAELKDRLTHAYDECDLLDILELDNTMLVNAFAEVIEDKFDFLCSEIERLDSIYPEEEIYEENIEEEWE